MPNLVFFEICVDDLPAAADFYARVFGWNIEQDAEDPESWSISGDDPEWDIPGALTARFDEVTSTVNTIQVPSLEQCASAITKAGGTVLGPPTEIEEVGYVQYCHDLEGNVFAILEASEALQDEAEEEQEAEEEATAD
jgi:predicted enzyme related to lactoylglutathione lyase